MFSQKPRREIKVGIFPNASQQHMEMIGHEAISCADTAIPSGAMHDDLSKPDVKQLIQPPGGAIFYAESPVNGRESLIEFPSQSRQIPTAC